MYYEYMLKKSMLRQTGFTLIELLVVIVIISILAALLMVNFVGVRQRGRDAQRKSDLRQIQTALELYRSDNGIYPASSPIQTCGGQLASGSPTIVYMRKIPCDPLNASSPYVYETLDSGNTYTIYACLENLSDPDRDTGFGGSPSIKASCTSSGYISITLTNP